MPNTYPCACHQTARYVSVGGWVGGCVGGCVCVLVCGKFAGGF